MKKKKKQIATSVDIKGFCKNAVEAACVVRATTEIITQEARECNQEYAEEYIRLLRILTEVLEPSFEVLRIYRFAESQVFPPKGPDKDKQEVGH